MSRLAWLLPKALLTSRRAARRLISRAGELRDRGRFGEAAVLYEEALRFQPDRTDLYIQCGHMFKEAGHYAEAERHYRTAAAALPDDADLALQLGHFYKTADRPEDARVAYEKALALRPRWHEAAGELQALVKRIQPNLTFTQEIGRLGPAEAGTASAGEMQRRLLDAVGRGQPIQPDLLPRFDQPHRETRSEELVLRQLGRPERTFWGNRRTVRGIVALRGFAISSEPIVHLDILVNGRAVHRSQFTVSYPFGGSCDQDDGLRKHVFNIWLDFSDYPVGLYEVEVRTTDVRRRRRSLHEEIVVERPLAEAAWPDLDGLVSIDRNDPRSVDKQINARPTMARSAQRSFFAEEPRSILVQRIDQLGDMIVSVPAVRRLRAVFPAARIVGLVSAANAEPAHALELFDEVLVTSFVEDAVQRRRVMPLDVQQDLLRMLEPYRFDLAIDLSDSGWSRPVLMLSGAARLCGFRANGEVPQLDIEVEGGARDRLNGLGAVPHAHKLLGLVEWLAALSRSESVVVPYRDDPAPLLAALGLPPDRSYAVLHDGARLQFSRWPGFRELARTLIERTDLDVVLLTDNADGGSAMKAPTDQSRFHMIEGQMPFATFNALLAGAAVFVGNDSGPKHLAAARGTPVVSIHSSRINWSEWGQQGRGLILSRKLPCAGCLIHHDAQECGRDFACIRDITVEEVHTAVVRVLADDAQP